VASLGHNCTRYSTITLLSAKSLTHTINLSSFLSTFNFFFSEHLHPYLNLTEAVVGQQQATPPLVQLIVLAVAAAKDCRAVKS